MGRRGELNLPRHLLDRLIGGSCRLFFRHRELRCCADRESFERDDACEDDPQPEYVFGRADLPQIHEVGDPKTDESEAEDPRSSPRQVAFRLGVRYRSDREQQERQNERVENVREVDHGTPWLGLADLEYYASSPASQKGRIVGCGPIALLNSSSSPPISRVL